MKFLQKFFFASLLLSWFAAENTRLQTTTFFPIKSPPNILDSHNSVNSPQVELISAAKPPNPQNLIKKAITVFGTVKDQNGSAIVSAQIVLRGSDSLSTVSDSNGNFSLSNVPSGNYELKVSANGFTDQSRKIIVNEQTQKIDITLEIRSLSITVTAEIGNSIERENVPQAINLIDEKQILERANPVLAQVAQEEVGVNLQRTSPTMGGLYIRGLVGAKVNVYVDGVRYMTSAMRGGVSTFFNLNEPSNLESIEILRGSNSAQYGSDALGGTVSLLNKIPALGDSKAEFHGEVNTSFNYADRALSGSTLFSFGTNKFGGAVNLSGQTVGEIRTAKGLDSHAAITRFLGLRSDILGGRLRDTAFQQYGGNLRLNYSPVADRRLIFNFTRSQQDNGKRYDQLLGGDGNLIADLKNLMLDFGYIRLNTQKIGWFDSAVVTTSYNAQREERVNQGGQGDSFANITHQYEKTKVFGLSGFLDKNVRSNSFLVGGDVYFEGINSPAYTLNPRTNIFTLSRPRVPDKTHYILGGIFVQNAWQTAADRLRISGAVRYNRASYKVDGSSSPIVNGFRLWNSDSYSTGDLSGRIGAIVRLAADARIAFSYNRGFRAPSATDLGTLGLTGDGFEADYISAQNLGGTIGTTADAKAVTTNLPVSKQRSETTDNYDFSFRYANNHLETDATFFIIGFRDAITKQTLILPAGATGKLLGDQVITSQNTNGAVFVSMASSPVLVRTNYTAARIYGFEYEAKARLTQEIKLSANYTYIYARDKVTGLPPNIEGGIPPATGFVSFKYEPDSKPFWFEFYSTLAYRQDRLSTLDLTDRRTGATRSRSQIENYFRLGACARGLTNNPDSVCGTGDETRLLATNETIFQVQSRLLGNANAAPLFTRLPGYMIVNLRGGIRIGKRSAVSWAFENIFDNQYRNASWGIDGAGRSFKIGFRSKF